MLHFKLVMHVLPCLLIALKMAMCCVLLKFTDCIFCYTFYMLSLVIPGKVVDFMMFGI